MTSDWTKRWGKKPTETTESNEDPISDRPFMDIEQFLIPQESNFSSTLIAGKPKPPHKLTKIEAFYNNFVCLSKNLNIRALIQTLKEDGFWSNIYTACSEQGSVVVFEKIYFLYKKLLICADNNSIMNYKTVIPCLLAHDLIVQVHREYGHIKSKKMSNLIGLKFEI